MGGFGVVGCGCVRWQWSTTRYSVFVYAFWKFIVEILHNNIVVLYRNMIEEIIFRNLFFC